MDSARAARRASSFRRRHVVVLALALTALAGCAASEPPRRLTERERDSVLAESGLPGATAVGSARRLSDRAAKRSSGLDAAATDSLFR
jgi:hypothetical protein